MPKVNLIMPKMGESVSEATVITWLKDIGDIVELDETIIEIATDKVDSEVPSTHEGKLVEKLYEIDDVIKVGQPFAVLEVEGDDKEEEESKKIEESQEKDNSKEVLEDKKDEQQSMNKIDNNDFNKSDRFYSPLVKNMAKKENINIVELDKIDGSGKDGRVTKSDMVAYIKNRANLDVAEGKIEDVSKNNVKTEPIKEKVVEEKTINITGKHEVIEMDRMRKIIAKHMVMSKQTSAHITSFVEADMTNIVNWRNKIKQSFKEREGQNITFTPIIIEAMVKAVKDFPMINVSVDDTNIILHKNINVGMATALPDGNLIVPVIKECETKNLIGITKSVNDLAHRARSGSLNPDDIQQGTITMTNVGTFGNLMGTPIINQPQVAIMAAGAIKKKPVVLETKDGDVIAIRHMVYLSLSYDHRVVDGALGGQFVRRVADYLEQFNPDTQI
tara:strand:- start:967 stop:2301 length:1335 start_codon:yes stop_codon:yes gene_type:complete